MNHVLARLPDEEQRQLRSHLELIDLVPRTSLCSLGIVARYAYFPITGTVSVISLTHDGNSVEVALIGREGMVGLPHLLHGIPAPYESTVQLGGKAYRLRADVFVAEFLRGATFQAGVLLALRGLLVQISQAAVCHRFHTVSQRLARSLLGSQDRTQSDTLELTQERLARQLGAARTGVSMAATLLQDQGVIRLRHGRIRILNRAGLERTACQCYHIVKGELAAVRTATIPTRRRPPP